MGYFSDTWKRIKPLSINSLKKLASLLGYGMGLTIIFQFYKCQPYWIHLEVQPYSTKTKKQKKIYNQNQKCYWRSQHSWRSVIFIYSRESCIHCNTSKQEGIGVVPLQKNTYLKCSQVSGDLDKIDTMKTHFCCWIWMTAILF